MKGTRWAQSGAAVLAASGLIVSVGAPAASAASNPYSQPETISIAFPGNGSTIKLVKNDPILQTLEKKFNVTFNLVTETWSNYDQQTSLWAASGQLPDIWFSDQLNNATYDQWVQQGLVAPIPSNLSQYPYLRTLMNESDVKAFAIKGQMYLIPRQLQKENVLPSDFGVAVRKDWMQKLHLQQPKTWNDFINILTKFVKDNPEHSKNVVGISTNNPGWLLNELFTFQFPQQMWWYKNSSGKWIPGYTDPKYLGMIQKLHQMYTTGLLDKDWGTTSNNPIEKFVNGQAGAIDQQPKELMNLENAWNAAHPKEPFSKYVEFLMMPPGPNGKRTQYVYYNWWSESLINSQVDSTKMQRILALYNYLISPQGRLLTNFGVKGTDYKIVNGKIVSLHNASWNIGTAYPSQGLFGSLAIWGNAPREGISEFNTANPVPSGWAKDGWNMVQSYIKQYMKVTVPNKINWTVNAYASGLPPITAGATETNALLQAVAASNPAASWNSWLQTQYKAGLTKEIQEVNAKFKNASN